MRNRAQEQESTFDLAFVPLERSWIARIDSTDSSSDIKSAVEREAAEVAARFPAFAAFIGRRVESDLGLLFERRGDLPQAVRQYRKLLRRRLASTQSRIILHRHIASLLSKVRRVDEAKRHLHRGLRLAVEAKSPLGLGFLKDMAELGELRPTALRARAFRIARPQRGRSRTGWTTETFHEAVLKERE